MTSLELPITPFRTMDDIEVPPAIVQIVSAIKDGWAIHLKTGRCLAGSVIADNVSGIVEFGAGSSSMLFAAAMSLSKEGVLTSREENPEWRRTKWGKVAQFGKVRSASGEEISQA